MTKQTCWRTPAPRAAMLLAAALVVIIMAILWWYPPNHGALYPCCYFHALTGLYCPGCGGTRAAYDLLHLHAADAFRHNPILFVLAPLIFYWGGRVGWQALRHDRWQEPPLPRWATYSVAVLVITYFIARNLPWWPFSCLRP